MAKSELSRLRVLRPGAAATSFGTTWSNKEDGNEDRMDPRCSKRPAAGTKTARVWDTADAITREKGRAATCREVRERYTAEGGNPNTANTQYSHWKADHDSRGAGDAPEAPAAPGRRPVGGGSRSHPTAAC